MGLPGAMDSVWTLGIQWEYHGDIIHTCMCVYICICIYIYIHIIYHISYSLGLSVIETSKWAGQKSSVGIVSNSFPR